jgi:hypothetical protein
VNYSIPLSMIGSGFFQRASTAGDFFACGVVD